MAANTTDSLSPVAGQALTVRGKHRSLFAFHHAPPGPVQRPVAVVMCPPLGFELLSTYRTYRHAAERLAELGFHVLRFDYFGTGNSGGNSSEAHNLVADVHAAVEEIKQVSGVTQVCLLGTRAGGLLATQAASQRDDIAGLILLATSASGRAYVREQKAFNALSSGDVSESGDGLTIAGFAFNDTMLNELGQIDVTKLEFPSSPRVLILSRDDVADDGRLLRHFSGSMCQVRQVAVAGYAAMMTTVETSVVPKRILDSVLKWSDEAYPEKMQRLSAPSGSRLIADNVIERCDVVEQAIRFGPGQRLFGIVSQPKQIDSEGTQRAVLLLNVGANHHIGSGRMYVGLARELAALGTTVLRFDVSGLGESCAAPDKSENVIYDPDSIADVQSAMQFLSDNYQVKEFILGGVCFGAHLAFYAASLEPRVVAQVLVNLAVFERQPVPSTAQPPRKSFKARSAYARAVFAGSTWRRIFKGQVAVIAVGTHLLLQSCRIAGAALKRCIYSFLKLNKSTNHVESQLRSVLQRGVRTLLIYSEADPALDALAVYFGADAGRVRQFGQFDLNLVSGADHTFNQPAAQRQLRNTVLEFVGTQPARTANRKQRT